MFLLFGLSMLARKPVAPFAPLTPTLAVSFVPTAPKENEVRLQAVAPTTSDVPLPAPVTPSIDTPIPAEPVPESVGAPPESPAPAAVAGTAEQAGRKVVESVQYIRAPVTRYPPQSRRLREQGVVLLEVLVDERGLPAQVEIERSSGYPRLDEAAREAVLQARFRPYTENGVPQSVVVLVPIRFALKRRY